MDFDKLKNAFQSARLTYRAMEDNDEDRKLYHKMNCDPLNFALGELRLFRPQQKASSDDLMKRVVKCPLAVWFCLPASHPDVVKITSTTKREADSKATKKEAEAGVKEKIGQDEEEDKDKEKLVPIGLFIFSDRGPEFAHHRVVMAGIVTSAPYQDKGYGPEAINWALDWAFRWGNIHCVQLGTVDYNTRAQHVYKKLGFVEEGRSREMIYFDRKWYDIVNFSMLEEEWMALRGIKE